MRFFRYGGVNVTYFLPKSLHRLDATIDPSTTNRLSLPSVRLKWGKLFEKKRKIIEIDFSSRKKRWPIVWRYFYAEFHWWTNELDLEFFIRTILMIIFNIWKSNVDHKAEFRCMNRSANFSSKLWNRFVREKNSKTVFFRNVFRFKVSFEGYTGLVRFNEYGERINYTLNVYQVTMNKLPRNVNFSRWTKLVF